jgi:hypothetical protein
MIKSNKFTEVQGFHQLWLWAILLSIQTFLIGIFFSKSVFDKFVGNNPPPSGVLSMLILFFLLLDYLFWKIKLETQIDETGVYYRFNLFQKKFKFHAWDDIETCYTRSYKPLWEFGGWGFRLGFSGGIAYNVSGNKGLQLVLKNNKKILIGTQEETELEAFLKANGRWMTNENATS